MKPTVVNEAEFARRILAEIGEQFKKLPTGTSAEESKQEFVRAKISVEFIATARKRSGSEDKAPEPCCTCIRTSAGIICSGDCCADVIDAEDLLQ